MGGEHETTRELRARQVEQEVAEKRMAETAASDEDAVKHARRAEKDAYLRQKLERRAEAETEAYLREREREDSVVRRRRRSSHRPIAF
jgi:hypothetical protein